MGFMKENTLELLIQHAIEYAEGSVVFAFQGGEPMLAGMDFFKKAIELQAFYGKQKPGLRIENTLQTNGILINEEWADFFKEHHFLIGISLDGPRKLHDEARVDTLGYPTFEKVMNAISILKRKQVDFNILTVVKEETTKKAGALYQFYKRNHFPYVQLIPCMDETFRQQGERSTYAVQPEHYGTFLCQFFDLWYADFAKGELMDIRMFSNLAQMAAGFPPEECGMCGKCQCYFVVEGDGSVYPCDFYCMEQYRLGTVQTAFSELKNSGAATEFERQSEHPAEECLKCKYYSLCRGGCRRFRESFTDGILGVNYYCQAYQIFLDYAWERIVKLGKTIIDPAFRKNL